MKIVSLQNLGVYSEKLETIKEKAKKIGHEIEFHNLTEDRSKLISYVEDADVLIIANMVLNNDILDHAKKLKFISIAFTGYNHIDLDYCRKRDIVVSNAPGYSTISVAELTIMFILSLLRNSLQCDTATRAGKTSHGLIGNDLAGKKVGIIGTGSIGTYVAKLLKAFGCDIYAFSRTERDDVKELGVKYLKLDDLMKICDIITIHCPSSESTKNLIGKKELEMMQSHAYLINTARADVVDQIALAEILLKKRIGGAGIDVFPEEPPIPVDFPILYAPNIVVTPHVGYATYEALNRRFDTTFENIFAWIEGKPKNVVT